MPNDKTDLNNNGAASTDNIGGNYGWPDGGYRERERIFQDHVTYQQGMLWFLANDERVPAHARDHVRSYGLPRDEFRQTGGWPHELYVREARRMVSDYAMTEHDCRGTRAAEDPVGLASYTMDSHNCKRVVVDGHPRNEGDVQVGVPQPYPVSYRSIVPAAGDCPNLLVPVCLSSSHIAYGSIRMEPVFMLLAHAAATAASLAIDAGTAVQDVDYAALRSRLRRDRMVLEWPPPVSGIAVETPELHPGEPGTATATLRLGIIAAGADVWVGIDQYGALFRAGAGGPDTVATTRLVSQDPTDPNARAGLAMRNDLRRAGSSTGYVLLVAKPENGFLLLWDADGDGYVESVARAGNGLPTPSPAWLRLERSGTTFTGAYSLDGATWTTIGTAEVPTAADTQDVGLICCSHTTAPGRALFDGLNLE